MVRDTLERSDFAWDQWRLLTLVKYCFGVAQHRPEFQSGDTSSKRNLPREFFSQEWVGYVSAKLGVSQPAIYYYPILSLLLSPNAHALPQRHYRRRPVCSPKCTANISGWM